MEMNVEQKIKGEVSKRDCNTSDASNAEDVPEEIQIEILSRLPPESLSRCKCVSKHWNDTLIIQTFLLRHFRSYDKHSQLVFAVCPGIWGKYSVLSYEPKPTVLTSAKLKSTYSLIKGRNIHFADFLMSKKKIYTSDICNDLICLFSQSSKCAGLLNIRTRDFIRLPAITIKSEELFIPWYALGFDPVHKVFKVLSIIYDIRECITTKAVILTVGSKYWKQIEDESLPSSLSESIIYDSRECFIKSICLDGVIYWVHENTIYDPSALTVIAFDLNRDTFRDYKLDAVRTNRYYLTSVKGCPTLFICKVYEVEQLTLFNHKNPNAAWNRRSFTSHDFPFPTRFPYDYHWTSATGGTILARDIESEIQDSIEPQKEDDSERLYSLYNLEKLAMETE